MSPRTVQGVSFAVVLIIVTAAFIWLLLPYYGAVLWAIILAILLYPLHRRLLRWFNDRRNLAAGMSTLATVCIVVIPGGMILVSLAREANSLYARVTDADFDIDSLFQTIQSVMPDFVLEVLAAFGLSEIGQVQARLASMLGDAAQTIAQGAVTIGQNTAHLFISLGVMLYVLFFMFRDGSRLAVVIRKASPLSDFQTNHILLKFTAVVKYTVRGNVIIALLQGAIGGVSFWLLGIEAALLWGVLMALLSLLPVVGAFLVWGPAAAFLLLAGRTFEGVILVLVGVFVISLIDNLLRPPLVGQGTKLPDYMVLVSTLGGLSIFGINGFVIGPLIAAMFVAVWSLFTDENRQLGSPRMLDASVDEIADPDIDAEG
jgi:predicted PurR-regulated permease PerM